MTSYGHFDDASRAYVITNPLTPRPWINYLGNRKLQAFISNAAGGMMWYLEPECRRITRYSYIASPSDRPGFYVYVKDRRTGGVWNPHFAPTCTPLDSYQCRHMPGTTRFVSMKDGIEVAVDYLIPLADNALLWKVTATNHGGQAADLQFASYIEFGIMEVMREMWWCYLRNHFGLSFDAANNCIRYDYKVYEALYAPAMLVGCTEKVSGFECSRDAFIGRAGSLENPEAIKTPRGLTNSELPIGGHACGTLGVDVKLQPGQTKEFAYVFSMADTWLEAQQTLAKYSRLSEVDAAIIELRKFWSDRLDVLQAQTGDPVVDSFINVWNPYQSLTLLSLPCSVSTDHMGIDGLRYRDTTQYALAPANLDPAYASKKLHEVFQTQKSDGMGSYMFWPDLPRQPSDATRRSDNTVWQIYTVKNLIEETGDLSYLDAMIPWRDGGQGSVYDHTLSGLKYIYDHRGEQGMPLLYYADWNDCLVAYHSEKTETVMLGMQLVYSLQQFAELAQRTGRTRDVQWCELAVAELTDVINRNCWDGQWYHRLLMEGGRKVGTKSDREGQIWINPQTWSVICGAGQYENRGRVAMQSVFERLNSPAGLIKQDPPFGTVPDPSGKPHVGQRPGVGENGGVFNHTNTWAIIAETMLGNNDRAFEYYRRCIPAAVSEKFGPDHYMREPYAYVSAVVGPASKMFGQGGISWITGTATWMYIAATQYLLGVKPTLDGLSVDPHLPGHLASVRVQRRFRGCLYDIQIDNAQRGCVQLEADGKTVGGTVIPLRQADKCDVRCRC